MIRKTSRLGGGADVDARVLARLNAFLRERTLPRFLAAREAMIASSRFDPRSTVLPDVFRLLARGHYPEILKVTRESMGNWLLNPGFHFIRGQALRELGDEFRSSREADTGRALLGGLLLTGDGSPDRPYLVLRSADEYDVLGSMGRRCRAHQVVFRMGRAYDGMACEDGGDVWFDVTAAAVPDSHRLSRPYALAGAVA
jgi:hypothetical protein